MFQRPTAAAVEAEYCYPFRTRRAFPCKPFWDLVKRMEIREKEWLLEQKEAEERALFEAQRASIPKPKELAGGLSQFPQS